MSQIEVVFQNIIYQMTITFARVDKLNISEITTKKQPYVF